MLLIYYILHTMMLYLLWAFPCCCGEGVVIRRLPATPTVDSRSRPSAMREEESGTGFRPRRLG